MKLIDPQPTYIRLPRDLHDAIKAAAELSERSMAAEIRVALRNHLAAIGTAS